METKKQWLWLLLKALLAIGILAGVSWQFLRILETPELQQADSSRSPAEILLRRVCDARLGWLVAVAALYLLGLGFPAYYWWRLQRRLGQSPTRLPLLRAYYVSHLGKYLPGKAWALVLRATLMRGPKVRLGVAGLAAFYEVLVTMAGGMLFGALLFALLLPDTDARPNWETIKSLILLKPTDTSILDARVLSLFALILLLPVGLPALPPIFNRLAHRLSLPFRQADAAPLPHVTGSCLVEGLLLSCGTWFLFGASLAAVFGAILDHPPDWTFGLLGRFTAFLAVGYVASFLIFVVPASLGVREYFLALFLVPEISALTGLEGPEARVEVVVAVLLLRVVWTLAELVMAGVLYWMPRGSGFASLPVNN